MASFIDRLIGDDFLWSAITSHISGRRRQSGTRFVNFNCPMCVSRGESADRKMRCGVKQSEKGLGVYCFNCGFKTMWQPGDLLSKGMREFLSALGLSEMEVKRLNHKAFTYRAMFEKSPEAMALLPQGFLPQFDSARLPDGAKSFAEWANSGCTDQDFFDTADYVFSRGEEVTGATTFFWTPNTEKGLNRRAIIPYEFEGRTVGWTARAIDPSVTPRYLHHSPPNFLFNARAMAVHTRSYIILVEGIFDALAIDGVATEGAHLNAQQAAWIKSYGKQVIVVPDRDHRGTEMVDVALANNWRVAFPALKGAEKDNWWEQGIKDTADAVKRYGRLYTIMSIIESSTDNKMEITFRKKLLA